MNNIIYFEIQASNPEELIAFYEAVFDWKFAKDENAPHPFYHITTPGINGILLQRPGQTPEAGHITNTFMSGIQVASLEQTAQKITKHGGSAIMAKMAFPGVKYQGYFRDPDNNIFCVIELNPEAQ